VSHNGNRLPIGLLKLIDIVLVVASFGLATVLIVRVQHAISLLQFLSMRIKISNFLIFGLSLLICYIAFSVCGLYLSKRLSSRFAVMVEVFKATTFVVACFAFAGRLFSIQMFTIGFLVTFWAVCLAVLCGFRLVLRAVLAHFRMRGRNLHNVLIFGTNPRAIAFARRLDVSPERGCRLLGFVDDDWQGMAAFRENDFPLVCDCSGLVEFLRQNVVDEVVMYLPFGSFYRYWSEVASLCEHHGIIVRLNADTFGFNRATWLAEESDDDSPYIATHTGAGKGWPLIAKRTLDLTISFLLIILLVPVFIAAAIAIKLTSAGPVFFLQERIGRNKRRFKIIKLRTMVPNAEQLMPSLESRNEVSGPVFKMKDDPRVTPVGRLLRRNSIDELPQLFNVLKGDMSLVGPRPLPVRDYEGFNEDWQRRRFSVRPGITCLWQVNGRSGVSFDQWMRLDLQYMDEWSLWLDLKILAKTVPAVLRGTGAA
jgi:exopolysaccharide biosynthesis polyprenyl glycosylphosphotransferase